MRNLLASLIPISLAAGLLTAPALAALQHEHRPGREMQSQRHEVMMPDMARVHAFSPAHLLERKAVLALTPQQVARLTELRDRARKAHDDAKAQHDAHREQMMEAVGAARPEADAVRAHFRAAHEAMGQAHWAMLEASVDAMAVLTEVQRARVEGWLDAMGTHGPAMRVPSTPER